MPRAPLPLLNVFEVNWEGRNRHVICFLETVLAGSVGIDDRSVIGEFTPQSDGQFNLESFRPNPGFVEAFTAYMNAEAIRTPELVSLGRSHPGAQLAILDPRCPESGVDDVPACEILGHLDVDAQGQLVPASFRYNPEHQWFSESWGTSGLLSDLKFYEWLHPQRKKVD
ncbi:MAG TPA: hypothetical protein VGY53_07335 [Isosphaeraceae bacterium]|jgi:hypothetical protein|nr:hypothetical protein [Isosphaeraceae bacterium]